MSSEVHELFRNNTIDKVQSASRAKRLAVEQKKDELRSLVGERHRDVIEAADSIQVMKDLSSTILDAVTALTNRCTEWDRCPSATINGTAPADFRPVLPLAAHLKFLNNVPDMVQMFLDSGDYFSAAVILTVGRFASTKLKLGSESGFTGIEFHNLILRLDEIFDHVESYILRACRHQLSSYVESPKVSSQCLVSLVLLENLGPTDIVQEYFNGRKSALERILGGKSASVEPNTCHISLKSQVALLGRFLFSTLYTFGFLFSDDHSKQGELVGSVYRSLKELCSWSLKGTGWLDGDPLLIYLPDDLFNFRLDRGSDLSRSDSLAEHRDGWTQGLSKDFLQKRFVSWWSELSTSCCSALTASLSHVSSVAALISLRTGALQLAHRQCKPTVARDIVTEVSVATSVNSVRLWEEIFAQPFLSQLSTLINREIDCFLDEWTTAVEQLMNELTDQSVDGLANSVFADVKPDIRCGDYWSGNAASDRTSRTDASQGLCCNTSVLLRTLQPDNFGLVVFCLLTGQPIPEAGVTHDSESLFPKTTSSPPAQLLLFLQRAAQNHPTGSSLGLAIHGESRPGQHLDLSQKLLLMPPSLQNICDAFDAKIIDLVTSVMQSAGPDWLALWTTFSFGIKRIFDRLKTWANALAYGNNTASDGEKSLKIEPSRGSLLAKSCKALTETCPSLCASIMASAGVMEMACSCDASIKSNGASFSWPEPSLMISSWDTACHPVIDFADHLLLDSLSGAILDKPRLERFSTRMSSAIGVGADEADRVLHTATTLLIEHDPSGALSSLTVPFDRIRIEPDSADERAVAVIHVPCSASLPLHEFLLTATGAIGRLVVHQVPSYPLNQELSFRIFSTLSDVYAKLLEMLPTRHDAKLASLQPELALLESSQFDLQPIVSQWIFDMRFLQKLLLWSDPVGATATMNTESRIIKSATCLLSSLEALIDPFDREVCFPMLSSSVDRCLQSCSHLYAPLTDLRASPHPMVNSPAVEPTNTDSNPVSASLVRLIPASSSASVFPTLEVHLTCLTDRRNVANSANSGRLSEPFGQQEVQLPRCSTSLVRSEVTLSSAP